jgi:hypothetical protein
MQQLQSAKHLGAQQQSVQPKQCHPASGRLPHELTHSMKTPGEEMAVPGKPEA